ncbi:MAG: DNRLRE domain-containing protein, partial [Terriglobales bacterium]
MNRTHFALKAQKLQFLPALLLFLSLFASAAHAQITPLGDSYINTADPTTNYGSKTLLDVDGASQATYIQFNLASIPSTASVSQATLKLYVNSVTTAGSFNVDYANGAWSEGTIDASNAPALGGAIASNVSVTAVDKNQYILVNVTSAVQAWLNGSETNNGLALVANSTFNATFDSKENTTTSHPAELDIAFAGGDGTITGVTTASGSGLTGGGTSGTLNLSLTSACATNQVLQWNGSGWVCSAAGTGTITGVTAGTDLTGGGASGNVTLNLNTANVPLLAANNTFTGNQTVNGNLSATGSFSAGPISATASSTTAAVTAADASSAGVGGVVASSTNSNGVYGTSAGSNTAGVAGTSTSGGGYG